MLKVVLPYQSNFVNWLKLYDVFENNKNKVNELHICFSRINFITPKYIVLLSCYLEHYYRNRKRITFINVGKRIESYLYDINFFEYFDIGIKRDGYAIPLNGSTIPLWNLEKEKCQQYSIFAKNFITNKFFKNKELLFLQSNLDELFNNVFDHANCPINGFVITQFFPNIKRINFSVCDLGKGIPVTINEMLVRNEKEILSDSKAIEHSTKVKVTAGSMPHNAGLGLNNIIGLCEDNFGMVEVWSNQGLFIKYKKNYLRDLDVRFKGTLINITIDTDKLENKEEEEFKEYNF